MDSLVAALESLLTITFAEADTRAEPALVPNDPLYPLQMCLHDSVSDTDIDAPEAWDITTGSDTLVLSVVDAGIDQDHPDLAGRDIFGDSGDNCDPSRPYHGTTVAGVLAASTNNATGVAGVNWQSRILNQCVDWSALMVAQAIDTSVVAGAAVINFSGTYPSPDTLETVRRSIMHAMMSGSTVVAATGNPFNVKYGYPAAFDPVCIGVAGATPSTHCGSHGPWMDVVARAQAYCIAEGGYRLVNGSTSVASPQVAGIVSLLRSVRPELIDRDCEEVIERTAVDLGDAGFDTCYGFGLAKAAAALSYIRDRTVCAGVSVPSSVVQQEGPPSDWLTIHWNRPPDEYPTGAYRVRTYQMVARDVPLPLGFSQTPHVWLRLGGTTGLASPSGTACEFDYPWGEVFDTTRSSASFRTYIYEVRDSLDNPIGWWPAPPTSACFAYTVAGSPTPRQVLRKTCQCRPTDCVSLPCSKDADRTVGRPPSA
ncbi:MAG: hypothetical protein EHM89_17810 [Acidobacteria bacterium]|nr:MAG: hypothetical protein EHM89_17810 [Acidobacteriota bacterium]